jgi:hypothetical protein
VLKRGKALETTRRAVSVFLLLLGASACGIPTTGGSSVHNCHSDAECPGGYSCVYAVFGSCGTLGICGPNDGTPCFPQTACGCDGTTQTVCLSNGNSPAPIDFLGSCDGAVQQGYDANLPPAPDASVPLPDATDAFVAPIDSAPMMDSAPPVDAADAADATTASTLGTPCSTSAQCTDPAYNLCRDPGTGTKICTAGCLTNADCQPPPNGVCNGNFYCVLQ